MPRFFFDTHDGERRYDRVGREVEFFSDIRGEALKLIPTLTADDLRSGSDRRTSTVVVLDAAGKPVYSVSVTMVGTWLIRDAPPLSH